MTVCKVKTFTHRIEPMENYHQICSSLSNVRSLTASCLWLSVLVLWLTILLFSFTLTTLISAMLWHLILSLFVTIKQICQSLCSYLLQTTFKLTFLNLPFQQKFSIFNLYGFPLCMNGIRLQVLRQPLKEFIHSVKGSELQWSKCIQYRQWNLWCLHYKITRN